MKKTLMNKMLMNKTLMNRMSIFFIIILLFMFGCSSYLKSYSDVYRKGIDPQNPQTLYDQDKFVPIGTGECFCFVCDQTSSFLSFTSLKEGACRFEGACTQEKFESFAEPGTTTTDKPVLRQFMIGQGSTFSDFGKANPYCADRLNIAVKWLTYGQHGQMPANKEGYLIPEQTRAGCFLSIGVMPLYILYSKGEHIDVESATKIAQTLNGVGPAIITTEIDFDSNVEDNLQNIRAQIKAMKNACPNCLIAVAPRMGDIEGLNKIFEDDEAKQKTDIVAYGINSRYSNSNCPEEESAQELIPLIYNEALAFSKNVMTIHGKPTLIAYILFDSEKPTLKECQLSEKIIYNPENSYNAYSYFFFPMLPSFIEAGTIGVAPYKFKTAFDPLECRNCNLARDKQTTDLWYGFCQKHKYIAEKQLPKHEVLAVYANPPESTAVCDYAHNFELYTSIQYNNRDLFKPAQVPVLEEPQDFRVYCDSCVDENPQQPFPFSLPSVSSPSGPAASVCTAWEDEISTYGDGYDLDPMLVRAVIWAESSGLDNPEAGRCEASPVLSGKNCFDVGYDLIEDPGPQQPLCSKADIFQETTNPDGTVTRTDIRYCAFGLMQVLESPYNYWISGDPYWDGDNSDLEIAMSSGSGTWTLRQGKEDRAIAAQCAALSAEPGLQPPETYKFNPFNPANNICMGSNKLRRYIDEGTQFAIDNKQQLNLIDPATVKVDPVKLKIVGTYFGLLRYNQGRKAGKWEKWVSDFAQINLVDPTTCTRPTDDKGNPTGPWSCPVPGDGTVTISNTCKTAMPFAGDFIKFNRYCTFEAPTCTPSSNPSGENDYASCVLARYKYLVLDPAFCKEYSQCTQGVIARNVETDIFPQELTFE